MLGRWREGLEALGSAVGYAEQVGDLFSLCRGLQYMSGVHLAQGRLEASRGTMERALHVAERMDNRRQIATTTYGLGLIDFLCGDWNAARVRGERALDIMRSLGGFWLSVLQAAGLSLALERGQWEAMPGALAECIGLSERGGNLPALREERILAEQELIEGRAEAAVSRLSALVDQPELEEQKALGLLPLLARAFLESGNPTRAEELLNDAMERARTEDLRLAVISWDRVRGTLRSHQGRWDEADRAFEESLSFARQLPYPYAEAQTLAGWGRTKARQGDAGAAAERLREAATIFERLGAAGEAR
jgi:tetratricopeptide (TPR) repeat protein